VSLRVRVLSDLHLEFFGLNGEAERFIGSLDNNCDVLVLAGDVAVKDDLVWLLQLFGQRFPRVVYVPGNHEYYTASPDIVEARCKRLLDIGANVHWLDNETVTIDGQRFVGSTLWFRRPRIDALKWHMTDFLAIRDFDPWVYEQNERSMAFLRETVTSTDVVITHHLPCARSIHPKYIGSALNAFFVCDMTTLIEQRQPKLWCHGHTHESMDYAVGETRIVCNPFGYLDHEVNPNFRPDFTIDV